MRVLAFLAFLAAYVGWLWLASLVAKRRTDILANKTFVTGELTNLLGLAAILIFIYILTGYANWGLMAALFAASQIGFVLSAILVGFAGAAASKWGARSFWAGADLGVKRPWLHQGIKISAGIIVLAYPIATGISYFTLPSTEASERVFQYTLSLFVLLGYIVGAVLSVSTLVSENLDEDTRIRFVFSQLGGLVPNALFLALLFSSFGFASIGQTLKVGSLSFKFSPLLLIVLITFFAFTVFIPYLIGAQRTAKWKTALLRSRKAWMSRLQDILDAPAGALYQAKLSALRTKLEEEKTEFINNDPIIQLGLQIDQSGVPKEHEVLALAYKAARSQDPRFQHLELLDEMTEKIGEIQNDLATEKDLEKAGKEWTKYLRGREGILNKEIARASKTRTPALLLLSGVIIPVFSVVLGEFAKWLWNYFSRTLLD